MDGKAHHVGDFNYVEDRKIDFPVLCSVCEKMH